MQHEIHQKFLRYQNNPDISTVPTTVPRSYLIPTLWKHHQGHKADNSQLKKKYRIQSALKDQQSERFRFSLAHPYKRPDKCLNTNKGLYNRQQGSKTLAVLCWYTHRELYSLWLSSLGTIRQFSVWMIFQLVPLYTYWPLQFEKKTRLASSFRHSLSQIQFVWKRFTPCCFFQHESDSNACSLGL